MKLGNDFTGDGISDPTQSEEPVQIDSEENLESNEKDNSVDSGDNKNQESDDESIEKDPNDDEDDPEDDETKSTQKETDEDKVKTLQGLVKAEKELGNSTEELDAAIAAAKQRISSKRKDRRDKRDLIEKIDKKFPEDGNEVEDDLSDIDPTTLEVLDRFTKAKGLVPKSELKKMNYQDQHNNAQEKFYSDNPEYLPENDPDDVLYNALKKELSYFSAPSDPKLIPKLFEKAHKEVVSQYPDKFKTNKTKSSSDIVNKSVRIKTQGIGGKTSGAGSSSEKSSSGKTFSKSQIRALEDGGWTKEEIDNLIK